MFSVASLSQPKSTNPKKTNGVYCLCLVYLCNIFTGVYCSFVGLFMQLIHCVFNKLLVKDMLRSYLKLHLSACLYLLWLIIPCLISYPFVGGSTVQMYGDFKLSHLVDIFTCGNLFDYGRQTPVLTVLVVFGFVVSMKRVYSIITTLNRPNNKFEGDIQTCYLLPITVISCFFYIKNPLCDALLNVLPFDFNFNNQSFIIGVHFCGVMLVGKALCWLLALCSQMTILSAKIRHRIKSLLVLLLSLMLIEHGAWRICRNFSMVEMSGEFVKNLRELKQQYQDNGRILVHTKLGKSWLKM